MKITPETTVNLWWIAEGTDEVLKFRAEALAAGATNIQTEPSTVWRHINVTFDVSLRAAFTTLKMNVDSLWDTCSPKWDDDPAAYDALKQLYTEVVPTHQRKP